MWTLSSPWWHFVLRALIVYGFLLVTLRFAGKRQIGQLTPFDLVLLLILSDAVQNAMNAGDNSVTAGLILAGTLIALNYAMGWLTFRSRRIERLVDGRPEVLIHQGKVYRDVMKRAQITHSELRAALRRADCLDVSDVHYAILENDGGISVKRYDKSEDRKDAGGEAADDAAHGDALWHDVPRSDVPPVAPER